MAKIEAVIFDWAGTTVDFGCFAPVQAFIEAFRAEGIEPTVEEVRKPMGMLKRDHVKAMMSMSRIHQLWKEKKGKEWDETHMGQNVRIGIPQVEIFFAPSPFERVVASIQFRIANKVVVATLTLI